MTTPSARYRSIHAGIWTDPKFQQLPPEGRLLLAYLLTNRHADLRGLYVLPMRLMIDETGLDEPTIVSLLAILEEEAFIQYSRGHEFVCIMHMQRYA